MKWMLLQDKQTGINWYWASNNHDGLICLHDTIIDDEGVTIKPITKIKSSQIEVETPMSLQALNTHMLHAWELNSRTATAGSHSFEVLASGRV